MAKLQVIVALCVIAAVLVSMLVPAEASTSCVDDEDNCQYCCDEAKGAGWTATWRAGGHFGGQSSCKCTSPNGDITQSVRTLHHRSSKKHRKPSSQVKPAQIVPPAE